MDKEENRAFKPPIDISQPHNAANSNVNLLEVNNADGEWAIYTTSKRKLDQSKDEVPKRSGLEYHEKAKGSLEGATAQKIKKEMIKCQQIGRYQSRIFFSKLQCSPRKRINRTQ